MEVFNTVSLYPPIWGNLKKKWITGKLKWLNVL